jgi:hypothetical protein
MGKNIMNWQHYMLTAIPVFLLTLSLWANWCIDNKLTKQKALIWLEEKYKELGLNSIDELEAFAHDTDDFELSAQIDLHIQAIL